jgi:hypothetical protein
MFEGDSADTGAGKFPLVLMGTSGGSRVRRPGRSSSLKVPGWGGVIFYHHQKTIKF